MNCIYYERSAEYVRSTYGVFKKDNFRAGKRLGTSYKGYVRYLDMYALKRLTLQRQARMSKIDFADIGI